jgi:hypothetical protein
MRHSESIKEIAAALAKAQAVMAGAKKDSENPAFNSRYADLASVVDAAKKPLGDNGLSVVQMPVTNDKDEIGVETMLMHASGEWIAGDAYFMPVSKANAHGFGSILTYARRYSLAAMLGIAPEDDDANAGVKDAPAKRGSVEPGPPRNLKAGEFQAFVTAMGECTNAEALQKVYTEAILACRRIGAHADETALTQKKDEQKAFIGAAKNKELALASQP